MRISKRDIGKFQRSVYAYYQKKGRKLPWRKAHPKPYHVFVSEIMLQQTQVDRVVDKFPSFIKKFPDFKSLADASLAKVITEWQGLGYNRRAKFIKRAAEVVYSTYFNRLPQDPAILEQLPGIGKATAASIVAFAFNKPIPFIETNIRSVFIHHFFNDLHGISDAELLPLVQSTIDKENSAKWYSALMDYGVHLKKREKNPSRKSRHYVRQKPFRGSDREIRGFIIKKITKGRKAAMVDLLRNCKFNKSKVLRIVGDLQKEELIVVKKKYVTLP